MVEANASVTGTEADTACPLVGAGVSVSWFMVEANEGVSETGTCPL